jgi:release factor glutamine methyltransferase
VSPGIRCDAALAAAARRIDKVDARVLLEHVLGVSRAALMTHPERVLAAEAVARYESLIGRRELGEPVAYLTGRREFYGLAFEVGPEALIPRPETEGLVDLVLEQFAPDATFALCDLGCGSGAIAVAVAAMRPRAHVLAVDASPTAVALTERNAARLLGRERLGRFAALCGDWYRPVGNRRFEAIVSNPPYIGEEDPHLAQGDLRYEPRSALAAGTDGLAALRAVVAGATARLNPGGLLAVEHGYDQGPACRDLLRRAGLSAIETRRDLSGIERITLGIAEAS